MVQQSNIFKTFVVQNRADEGTKGHEIFPENIKNYAD